MEKFAEQLVSLRKQAGMSQEELAEKLQLTRQTISKWETGASTPDLELLVRYSVFRLTGCWAWENAPIKREERRPRFSHYSASLCWWCLLQVSFSIYGKHGHRQVLGFPARWCSTPPLP